MLHTLRVVRVVITPCTCARGKVIGSVHLSAVCRQHKNRQIWKFSILVVDKCDHIVGSGEKLPFFCFLTVDTRHEYYVLYDYVGHAYQLHLAHDHVLIQLCMLELNIGKDGQVIIESACQMQVECFNAIAILHVRCNGCRARGSCALESSSSN